MEPCLGLCNTTHTHTHTHTLKHSSGLVVYLSCRLCLLRFRRALRALCWVCCFQNCGAVNCTYVRLEGQPDLLACLNEKASIMAPLQLPLTVGSQLTLFSGLAQPRVVLKKPALKHSSADCGAVHGVFDRPAYFADVVLLIKAAGHARIEFGPPSGSKNDLAVQDMQLRSKLKPGLSQPLVLAATRTPAHNTGLTQTLCVYTYIDLYLYVFVNHTKPHRHQKFRKQSYPPTQIELGLQRTGKPKKKLRFQIRLCFSGTARSSASCARRQYVFT